LTDAFPNPKVEQLEAILAAKIIGILDDQELTVRRAHELTGFAAADFSRVRQAKLSRFTVDRLMSMLDRLDQQKSIRRTLGRRKSQTEFVPNPKADLDLFNKIRLDKEGYVPAPVKPGLGYELDRGVLDNMMLRVES